MPGGSFTAKNGRAGALHRAELRRIQLRPKTTQTKTTDHFQAEIRIRLFCVLEGEGFLLKYKINSQSLKDICKIHRSVKNFKNLHPIIQRRLTFKFFFSMFSVDTFMFLHANQDYIK